MFKRDNEKHRSLLNGKFVIKLIKNVLLCLLSFDYEANEEVTMKGNDNVVQSVPAIGKANCAGVTLVYFCFTFKLPSSLNVSKVFIKQGWSILKIYGRSSNTVRASCSEEV